MQKTISIRCSSLPSWFDCPRRAAAGQFSQMITDKGYTLKPRRQNIGAIVGTATHAGASEAIAHIIKTGEDITPQISIERSIQELDEQFNNANDLIYDNETTSKNDAQKQTVQLTTSFLLEVLPELNPTATEIQRRAVVVEGVELTGKCDIETSEEEIGDIKCGKSAPACQAQLGGYSLLRRSEGAIKTAGLFVSHLPRTSLKKSYPGASVYKYAPKMCEEIAYKTIAHISRSVAAFEKTGDRWSFGANPMSRMCSEKYCPVWGTDFCEFGIKKENV